MKQESREQPDFLNMRESFNWLYVIAKVYSMTFLPIFRCRWGVEGFGVAGGLAFIVLLFMMHDPIMTLYFWLWLLSVLVRRLEAWNLYRKGEPIHSEYQGDSELKMLPETVARVVGEPVLVGIAGAFLMQWSPPAGMFFSYGAIALFVKAIIEQMMIRRQMRQLRDTEILMRNYGGAYRDHGGRW